MPVSVGRLAKLGAVLVTAGMLASGCATCGPPIAPVAAAVPATPPPVTVYVAYNSFHAGMIVPTAEVAARPGATATALTRLKPQPWTVLGYGDSKFYQQSGINPGRILDFVRSMLAPGNPSVVQVRGLDDPLTDGGHPKLIRLSLTPESFDRLVRHVDSAFRLENGRPVFVAAGSGGNDSFFRGDTPASALHECNQWIGEALGAAGVPHSYLLDSVSDGLAADLVGGGRAVRVSTTPGAKRVEASRPAS